MKRGLDALQESGFISLMEDIHERTINAYFELADCFFVPSEKTSKYQRYAVRENDGRYELLPREDRQRNLARYLSVHDEFSERSKFRLGELATDATTSVPGQDIQDKLHRDSFMVNGPAFSTVFTGVKDDNGYVEWRIGINPVVFSTRDFLQASRGTEILFRRTPNTFFDRETKREVEEWERNIVRAIT